MKKTAGKALKKVFRQEDLFDGIEPQYAKVSLLMNPTRLDIYLDLMANPCNHLRGISRALDVSAPTVSWHMKKMIHSGYVDTGKYGSKNIFWVMGMISPEDVDRFAVINSRHTKAILKFAIDSGDGFREREIVKLTGDDQQLVSVRLKKLVEADLLAREGSGVRTLYSFSGRLKEMKDRYLSRVPHAAESLVTVFTADGLRPRIIRKRGNKITVELTLPEGKKTLSIDCNPMKPYLRKVG